MIFPIKIRCKRIVDKNGLAYGRENEFCGKELSVEEKDIRKHFYSSLNGQGTDYGVICPECGKFIVISKDSLPMYVINFAKSVNFTEDDEWINYG